MYKNITKWEKIKNKAREIFRGHEENVLIVVALLLVIGLPLIFVWNPIASKKDTPKNEPQVLQASEIPIPDDDNGGGNPGGGNPGGGGGGNPPPNGTPNADNDFAETRPVTPVRIPVLDNDRPRNNVPIDRNTLIIRNNPSKGTVVINPDRTVTYTPNPGIGVNDEENDDFRYEICATNGRCSTENVRVRIAPPGVPAILRDTATTLRDIPVDINVLANDRPRDSVPLDLTTIRVTTPPTNGTAVRNPDNTYRYTPRPGYVGPDRFVYEVCATNGRCDDAEVNITVRESPFGPVTNQPPVATPDTATTPAGTVVNIPVLNNDFDPDGNLVPGSVIVRPPATGQTPNGTTTVNPTTGVISFTPNPGFVGPATFIYEVKDDDGVPATATVNVTVTPGAPVSRPPVANDDTASTPINTPINIAAPSNDSDPDNDLNPASVVPTNPANGTITTNPTTGVVTYTPNNNYTGPDTFTYTISDNTGKTDTATVTINVLPNQAPTAVDDISTTTRDQPVTINVINNDTDPNNGLVPGSVTVIDQPDHGSFVVQPDGRVIYTPVAGYIGTDTFVYRVSNNLPTPLSDTATVTINVTDTALPLAVNDSASTPRNQSTEIAILSNDQNPLGPITPALFDRVVTPPTNGSVTFNTTTGKIVYTPTSGYSGTDSFTYQIRNANGTSIATVNLDVTAPNGPDARDDTASTGTDFPVTIPVLENDTDPTNSLNPSTLTIETQPSNGTLTTDLETGRIIYTPNDNYTGPDSFTYEICNEAGGCDTATVNIIVTTNPKPDARDDTAQTTPNNGVSIPVLDNDTDPSGINPDSLEVVSNPANGTVEIDEETNQIIYTPNPGFVGQDQFVYKITNEFGETDTAIVNVFVGVNPTGAGRVLGVNENLSLERTGGLDENLSNVLVSVGLMLAMSFFGSLYFIKAKRS